ncbi:MAG TPA: class I SAM-dependent methyltransferase [Segeticoccus sp.]|uniref:class I SAM-dependent methyltransferase n=1 Tax=Segeticoccus sp. TaxID=2706531 RepID=UPI002D7F29EF|nr:class I SAM-dependent methyltransferase [Segeticoccus sp.]HET8600341.1 class I SAM-dependent methyltransferase [Segeticoccus sp.]
MTRQLAAHLPAQGQATPPPRAVDVGAGQGTQALALAARGLRVDAVEPDPEMRRALSDSVAKQGAAGRPGTGRVRVVAGSLGDLPEQVRH